MAAAMTIPPAPHTPDLPPSIDQFDPDSTLAFQSRMERAPEWFCSFLASNSREKRRFRDELVHMKGAWPLLMKQRNDAAVNLEHAVDDWKHGHGHGRQRFHRAGLCRRTGRPGRWLGRGE